MTNRELDAAWKYHNETKHSQWSVRNNAHFLDWANQPLPFKIYPELEPILLPREAEQTGVAAFSAIAGWAGGGMVAAPDLKVLSLLLYFSSGITRQRNYPGGEIYFRAAACTGALYEIELYVVCGDLPDLEAGVYHFGPADFALRRLRSGDWRGWLARASGNEPAVAQAPATIVCSGTYWRNAWKYQARTYRHFGWDNGTLLANLLAMSAAQGLAARLVLGFVDNDVNRLLALDTQREVAFSMVAVGLGAEPARSSAGEPQPLELEALPVSRREVDYPEMRELHAASSLRTPEEVAAWREGLAPTQAAPTSGGEVAPLQPMSEEELPRDPIERVILRRGSTRQFVRKPITLPQLSTMLDAATRGLNADFLAPGEQLNDLYLIVNAVEGLKPGTYFFDRARRGLEILKQGDFRREAHFLGLEQDLPGDASVAVFFLADLKRILERCGNRGYRAAQLEAGILGGKLYLAAYALRLGATGLTFYDDDVVRFFSPQAEGKCAIFLTAIGHSAKRVASTE
ncbi:MAG: SagB/ThcOx family dehydrogenase [Terriglobales bacterium]